MKLKNILSEILINEVSDEIVDKFADKCAPFIRENANQLNNDKYILRATEDYNQVLIQRGPRERIKIRGDAYLYYFYESMRGNLPSRKDLIPAAAIKETEYFEGMPKTYAVFPIGGLWKFVNFGVHDFNFNALRDSYKPQDPFSLLEEIYYSETNFAGKRVSEDLIKDIDYVNSDVDVARKSRKPDKIYQAYSKLIDWLDNNEPIYEDIIPQVYDELENTREYMKALIERIQVGSKITEDMSENEVGVYAPNGFWYVDIENKEEILEGVLWSDLI